MNIHTFVAKSCTFVAKSAIWFSENEGGVQRPFGTFPKIHPFWWHDLSPRSPLQPYKSQRDHWQPTKPYILWKLMTHTIHRPPGMTMTNTFPETYKRQRHKTQTKFECAKKPFRIPAGFQPAPLGVVGSPYGLIWSPYGPCGHIWSMWPYMANYVPNDTVLYLHHWLSCFHVSKYTIIFSKLTLSLICPQKSLQEMWGRLGHSS